jgi:hypothetical protein
LWGGLDLTGVLRAPLGRVGRHPDVVLGYIEPLRWRLAHALWRQSLDSVDEASHCIVDLMEATPKVVVLGVLRRWPLLVAVRLG